MSHKRWFHLLGAWSLSTKEIREVSQVQVMVSTTYLKWLCWEAGTLTRDGIDAKFVMVEASAS